MTDLHASVQIGDTSAVDLDAVLRRAADATEAFASQAPSARATQLRAAADALDAAAEELVDLAMAESHLSEARLTGELRRSTFQIRFIAGNVERGDYLQATIDQADADFPLGPKPDLRRVMWPVGPVLVFAASNFPFAFAVPGGDTASALAAGCPVVVKGHPGHPRLSVRVGEIMSDALTAAGAPQGAFAVVLGAETGVAALTDERIAAAAFTGSIRGGRALFDIANSRPTPIPFFGELGSLNPVFATPAAVRARGAQIAEGYVASFTGNAGQLCTKPGILFVPAGHGLADDLVAATRDVAGHQLLNGQIHAGYCGRRTAVLDAPGVQTLWEGTPDGADGPTPTLLATDVATLLAHRQELLEEVFGPLSILVEYTSTREAWDAAEAFEGNLTGTVHAEAEDDDELVDGLLARLQPRVGRILFNGWPTGVAVSPAQQHGGPYPSSTDSRFTSVGAASITRFLRPIAYQNVPEHFLPAPLRAANPWGVPQDVHAPWVPSQ
jgi:NADP-dependent aldehyde dehydrogenase